MVSPSWLCLGIRAGCVHVQARYLPRLLWLAEICVLCFLLLLFLLCPLVEHYTENYRGSQQSREYSCNLSSLSREQSPGLPSLVIGA